MKLIDRKTNCTNYCNKYIFENIKIFFWNLKFTPAVYTNDL